MSAMSAPVVMSIEQIPTEGYVPHMMVPHMVPCCFVAMPEFCEGMQIHPSAGWQPMWSQGARKGQPDSWQGSKRGSPQPSSPNQYFFAGPMWPQQGNGNEEPVSIELSNLPEMLCNPKCLEASIEQAGLENHVQGLEVESGGTGKAILTLASRGAAQQCIRHFNGLRWAKSSEPVSARYCSQDSGDEARASAEPPLTEEAKAKKTSEIAKGLADAGLLCKTTKRTPPSSPFSSCSTTAPMSPPMVPMKPRWADYDDDEEDDDKWSTSTHADEEAKGTDSGSSSNTEC